MPSKSINTLFPKVETLNKKLLIQAKEKTENKTTSAEYRKRILESQARNNYRNEFDKITGALQNKALSVVEARRLNNRRKELKKLAQRSINPLQHPVLQK